MKLINTFSRNVGTEEYFLAISNDNYFKFENGLSAVMH